MEILTPVPLNIKKIYWDLCTTVLYSVQYMYISVEDNLTSSKLKFTYFRVKSYYLKLKDSIYETLRSGCGFKSSRLYMILQNSDQDQKNLIMDLCY